MTQKYSKKRPAISSETKREVAIESGHSCAIKHCTEHTYNEYHHIDQNRENNNPDNLIYLCDKHHKMAHKGIIDKKALRKYKQINSNCADEASNAETDNKNEYKIDMEYCRPLDVLEDKFTPNSKEIGIKLFEIWVENKHKYTQEDFARLLNIPGSEIGLYFSGTSTLKLQQLLNITEVFNLSKSFFFEGTYWMRKAYWKEDIVKYSVLSLVNPKSSISSIANEGEFYGSIFYFFAKKICTFYKLLYVASCDEIDAIFPKEKNTEISSELKEKLDLQYYKILEQYPDNDNSRELLDHEKILDIWFFASGEYISRILIEGIKSIDITDINKPVVICRFDKDIENKTVTPKYYNETTLTMERA